MEGSGLIPLIVDILIMKIVSWNVKGLRSSNKRMKILSFQKRYHPDIVFLQETHLTEADFYRMNKLWVGQTYGSPVVQGKAGVLTLYRRIFLIILCPMKIIKRVESPSWWLSGGREFTLCNIYCPNGDN